MTHVAAASPPSAKLDKIIASEVEASFNKFKIAAFIVGTELSSAVAPSWPWDPADSDGIAFWTAEHELPPKTPAKSAKK